MFESCADLLDEYAQVESQLSDPAVHGDQAVARRLGRRFAELGPIVAAYREWLAANDDLSAARELGEVDEAFEWLNRAYVARDTGLAWFLRTDPFLANIRSDARYTALLAKMKLPED